MTEYISEGDTIKLYKDDFVANVIGSSAQKGNWKKYWANYTDFEWPKKCSIYYCGNKATVGGHIYVKNIKSNKYYFILPICQSCNKCESMDYGSGWVSVKRGSYAVVLETHDACFD
jgi:hypothetical protein